MAKQDISALLKLRRSERDACQAVLSEAVALCTTLAQQKRAFQDEIHSLDETPQEATPQELADRDSRRQHLSQEHRLCGRKLILAQERERQARERFMESQKQVRAMEAFLEKQKESTQWELRRRSQD